MLSIVGQALRITVIFIRSEVLLIEMLSLYAYDGCRSSVVTAKSHYTSFIRKVRKWAIVAIRIEN